MWRRKTREKNLSSYVGVIYRSTKNSSHWQGATSLGKINVEYAATNIFLSRTCSRSVFFPVPMHCPAQRGGRKKLEFWQNAPAATERGKNSNGAAPCSYRLTFWPVQTWVFLIRTFDILYLYVALRYITCNHTSLVLKNLAFKYNFDEWVIRNLHMFYSSSESFTYRNFEYLKSKQSNKWKVCQYTDGLNLFYL